MAELDKQTYNAHTRAEGAALLAAAAELGGTVAIPTVEGWDMNELVIHTGRVWGYMAECMANGSLETPQHGFPDKPADGDSVNDWAQGHLDGLLAQLDAVDVDQPMWNFGPVQTGAFFPRRMAVETAIHRWDAQSAGSSQDAIDADLAADAINELFEISMPRTMGRMEVADLPSGSLHLHRTDGEGEWMVQIVDGKLQVTEEHGKGDAAVRGTASDLLLYCWNRNRGDSLEIFGDEAVVDAWGSVKL